MDSWVRIVYLIQRVLFPFIFIRLILHSSLGSNSSQGYMLLCFWPSVHAVCPNHEVVVFRPWTVITPDLGSVANYTFYSNPPAPPVSTVFMDIFVSPLYSTTPPSVALVVVASIYCNLSWKKAPYT